MNEENKNLMLGEQFEKARTALRLSIDDISNQIKIPIKYLSWLEEGDYEKLPAEVYVRGFIIKYSQALSLNPEVLFNQYLAEAGIFNKIRSKKNIIPVLKSPKIVITPKLIAILASLIIFAGVLGYFGWQVYFLIRPPRLILDNPFSDLVTNGESQLLEGNAFGANILMINDKTVGLDSQGHFSEILNLSKGLNVIELKAKNSLGKETTLIRKIILNK